METIVRDASSAECAALAEAVAILFERYGVTAPGLAEDLRGALVREEKILGAWDGEVPLGLAWVIPNAAFVRGAYLRLIAVAPSHQSKGIGALLLGQAERWAASGSRSLFLLVSDFNLDAQRFYQDHGYERVGRLSGFARPDIDELLYWKRFQRL